ncbi:MAG: uncharacterized protein KVP18_000652 [Porospora cf. gigantea A]|nr:MAG: hypothetical protein KVP18_000652 [Porospora cf. gigantea A]
MIAAVRVKRPQDPSLPEFDTEYNSHRLSWPSEFVRGRCQRSHTRLASTKLKGKWTEAQVANGINEEVFDGQNRQHPPGLGEPPHTLQTDLQPFDQVTERNFDLR